VTLLMLIKENLYVDHHILMSAVFSIYVLSRL
jgi:hypothetical protein